jgi:hypothetical protein
MHHEGHFSNIAGLFKVDVELLFAAISTVAAQNIKFTGPLPALTVGNGHGDLGLTVITSIVGSIIGIVNYLFNIQSAISGVWTYEQTYDQKQQQGRFVFHDGVLR